MKRSTIIEVLALLAISAGIFGCIGYKAYPLAARSGDTISLALGGTAMHETSPGNQIKLEDINISIQQDINGNGAIESSETFTVTKRYLFRLYPDVTSLAANFSATTGNAPAGEWIVVLDLADPVTNTPLPLTGDRQARIVVTTSKLKNNMWGTSYEGTLNNVPITILPGTGASNNFNNGAYSNMTRLQPLPQLAVGFTGTTSVAAAALDIDYDETVLKTSSSIKVVQSISLPNVILNQRIYKDSNNDWKMRILLMTNTGLLSASGLKCFIVWDPTTIASGKTVTANTFSVTSAKFYNESGTEVVSGITVTTKLLYQ